MEWVRAAVAAYLVVTAACGRIDFAPRIDAGEPTPLVWLPMDDPPGSTTLHDASGHGHDATCVAATCPTLGVAGMVGSAALFDGVDDFAQIAFATDLEPPTMTIAAWVRVDAQSTTYAQIASRQHGSDIRDVWVFGYESPTFNSTRPYLWGGSVGAVIVQASGVSSDPDVGSWVRIVATFDGSTMRLYRAGVEMGELAVPGTFVSDTTDIFIGAANNGAPLITEFFTGAIDDLRIYATALDDAAIAKL
jgi:hypothetical protein